MSTQGEQTPSLARRIYTRWLKPHVSPIMRQRLKLGQRIWGYKPLLSTKALPLQTRLNLIRRFLIADWNILHGHTPLQVACICKAMAEGPPPREGEAMVEAGCWNGGSTVKFSIIGKLLGYQLAVYDSFEGVEPMGPEDVGEGYDFSGEYAAPEELVLRNLERFGEVHVTTLHKGWYKDTLAHRPLSTLLRVVYIDCDTAKGTREALSGTVPALAPDGWIFSQDYHIDPVRKLLMAPETWLPYGKGMPTIKRLDRRLVSIQFLGSEELVYENVWKGT